MKTKSGRVFALPGLDEEAAIRAGIAADPDTCELPDSAMKRLRPVGRPKADAIKQPVSIRLSPEVVAYFKATGKGWQTRMDEALREYVEAHR
jgi:uncharacterized protein (DUF4415 family)